MRDVWRQLNPGCKEYTFYSAVHDIYIRIDYILVSNSLIDQIQETNIGNRIISDHSWVTCSLIETKQDYKITNWILNKLLLHQSKKTKFNFIKLKVSSEMQI